MSVMKTNFEMSVTVHVSAPEAVAQEGTTPH